MVRYRSQEVTEEPFSTTNNSVNSAFSSVYYAEQNGGDVSRRGRLTVYVTVTIMVIVWNSEPSVALSMTM